MIIKSNNLKKYRIWKDLKQRDLSELLKIPIYKVRGIENNEIDNINKRLRRKICNLFNVSEHQMFSIKKER